MSVADCWLARAAAQAEASSKRPLIWAADAEGGAPYIFKDPKNPNRNIGFEVDIAAALAKELGRPITFRQYEFEKLIPGLERGEFDFAMNGLEITPDRQKRVRFSKPYYAFKLQLVTRRDEVRFASLQGCKDIKGLVGTLEDTAASRLLDQQHVRKKIYSGQVEPYKDLADKVVDAVLLDLPIANYYARKSIVTPEEPDLKFVGDLVGRGYYAIAFNPRDEALASEVDAALDRLFAQGTLRRVYQKWSLWNDNQEEFLTPGVFREDDEMPGVDEGDAGGFLGLLLDGAWMTVRITCWSFLLAVVIALPIALARLYGPWPLRTLATLYVEFFRGIPVLLLLVFLYYGLPAMARAYGLADDGITLKMDAFAAAVLGFGLNYAAYESEIYRAGIRAVPAGQWEAAGSLGMSGTLTFRRIILPQAIRIILPPMTNDLVALFKDTSVVSVIAVVELSKQYQILTKSTSDNLVSIALATAALYLIMSVPLGYLSRFLERRWALHD
jgi:polar amino acid transport system substrate-binding protein